MSIWHRRAHLEAVGQTQQAAPPEDISAGITAKPSTGVPPTSPFYDPAFATLDPAPITDELKSNAWDHYFSSKTPQELHQRLTTLNLPVDTHNQLVAAKEQSMPALSPAEQAIQKMATMDPSVLDVAEKNPNVMKLLTSAALKD